MEQDILIADNSISFLNWNNLTINLLQSALMNDKYIKEVSIRLEFLLNQSFLIIVTSTHKQSRMGSTP